MQENRKIIFPVIGKVQHGEQLVQNGKKRVKEYGYFIAKTQNAHMQAYLNKFDELIKGAKNIDITFVDNNPLTIKRERYTTVGKACYCKDNETIGMQKQQNQWKEVECNSNCPYSQRDENGKSACNRIAWLKFFIPSITTNRIWLMKITGQESIDNLDAYFTIQKMQGKSLNNIYTIFLTQKEQKTSKGQTFNNYILDIIEKENFVSDTSIPKQNQMKENLSTKRNQNVNNQVVKKTQLTQDTNKTTVANTHKVNNTQLTETEKIIMPSVDTTMKTTSIKTTTKRKSKKNEEQLKEQTVKKTKEKNTENFNNYYILLKTYNETIENKGQTKEYLIGEFSDMNDKISKIIIRPENAEEIMACDLGTIVKLDIQEVGNRKFAIKLEFIEKRQKNIAA